MKIFITGDTHQGIDIGKLSTRLFVEQKKLTKEDFLIICGDVGLLWNNSKEELFWRKWMADKNFTTLFIDGNHENFNLLYDFPLKKWNGGWVRFINDSLIHLSRGQVFNINGKTFFTMGGASSVDKMYRKENVSWWKEETPSNIEYETAIENLEKNNWEVDYIITHTAPNEIINKILCMYKIDEVSSFLNFINNNTKFKHWYFGHFHDDLSFEKHTMLFNKIIEIKD